MSTNNKNSALRIWIGGGLIWSISKKHYLLLIQKAGKLK